MIRGVEALRHCCALEAIMEFFFCNLKTAIVFSYSFYQSAFTSHHVVDPLLRARSWRTSSREFDLKYTSSECLASSSSALPDQSRSVQSCCVVL
eukprot:1151419-Pelagomonas_calceolata.AAC.1